MNTTLAMSILAMPHIWVIGSGNCTDALCFTSIEFLWSMRLPLCLIFDLVYLMITRVAADDSPLLLLLMTRSKILAPNAKGTARTLFPKRAGGSFGRLGFCSCYSKRHATRDCLSTLSSAPLPATPRALSKSPHSGYCRNSKIAAAI